MARRARRRPPCRCHFLYTFTSFSRGDEYGNVCVTMSSSTACQRRGHGEPAGDACWTHSPCPYIHDCELGLDTLVGLRNDDSLEPCWLRVTQLIGVLADAQEKHCVTSGAHSEPDPSSIGHAPGLAQRRQPQSAEWARRAVGRECAESNAKHTNASAMWSQRSLFAMHNRHSASRKQGTAFAPSFARMSPA